MTITTHVLDTARGRPAAGIPITLDFKGPAGWERRGSGATDADGRLRTLVAQAEGAPPLAAGVYRITFDTGAYFAAQKVEGFYPEVTVVFEVRDASAHYHVPLLVSPYGYSTYRGS